MLGWGLGVTMTPMSTSAIITARWAEVSPWTVTTRWNALFIRCLRAGACLGGDHVAVRVVAALMSMRALGDEPCQSREFRRPLRMIERAGQADRNVGHRHAMRWDAARCASPSFALAGSHRRTRWLRRNRPSFGRFPATDHRDRAQRQVAVRRTPLFRPPSPRSPQSQAPPHPGFPWLSACAADRSPPACRC